MAWAEGAVGSAALVRQSGGGEGVGDGGVAVTDEQGGRQGDGGEG